MSDEPRGPVVLREKPRTMLANRSAYALHEDDEFNLEAYQAAADWVRFYGGEVKHVDHEGLLITSRYEDGESYHEWVSAPAVIVHDPEHREFSTMGYTIHEWYVTEPTAPGREAGS